MKNQLDWTKQYDSTDDNDNSEWEAPSIYCGDTEGGDIFQYRIRQRFREDRIEFYEASDAEVMEDEDSPFFNVSLDKVKKHCQKLHDIAVKYLEDHPEERIQDQ